MVSLAYILTILSVFSAVVLAEDVKSSQPDAVEEKWLWGNGIYGRGYFGFGYGCTTTYPWLTRFGTIGSYAVFTGYPRLWFKEAGNPAVARRSISIDAEHIYQRRDESSVACKDQQGQLEHFVLADCHQAVQNLATKKVSSASCKSCTVKIVSPKGELAVTGAPAEALQKIADKMLKSCSAGTSQSNHARRSPEEAHNSGNANEQIAMIIQKGNGGSCE